MRASGHLTSSFFLGHVVAPLALGGLIYLGLRATDLWVFAGVEALGALPGLLWLRAFCEPASGAVPAWIVGSLPDGLWVYSVTAFMLRLWQGAPARTRLPWAGVGAVLGLGWEACQGLDWVPGTFDVGDLVATMAMAGLACAMFGKHRAGRRLGEVIGS